VEKKGIVEVLGGEERSEMLNFNLNKQRSRWPW